MITAKFTSILLIFAMLQYGHATAQDSTAKPVKNCEYRTDGKPGAYGLRLSVWVPCSWTKEEPANASIMASYTMHLPDSNILSHTLTVNKMDRPIPDDQLAGLMSTDGYKMIARQTGKYVSGSKIRIADKDVAEVRYWNQYKQGTGMLYSYGVQYYIPLGDKIISAIFIVGAADKDAAKALFGKHETEFRNAAKTLLLR